MNAIGKILVVRLSSIGDIILTTPLLRSLKKSFPQAQITFVIKKQYEELLCESPYIDELITFNSKDGFKALKKIKQKLKAEKFDLYLDIHKNWRSRYIRLGLGAGRITSYHKQIVKRTLLIWFKINLYRVIKPVYQRYFESAEPFGVSYDETGTEIHFHPDKGKKVMQLLNDSGYRDNMRLVVICPSATYFNKRWKAEGFITTAKYLVENKNAFVVVHGGPEDVSLCNAIVEATGKQCVNMAGMLSLSGSAALLNKAALVIANDSGLLHMAQSQKVHVVGIYGATTRELGYFPIDIKSTVVETHVACRPCTHNGLNHCPKKHFRCMNDITPDMVINAALQYLT